MNGPSKGKFFSVEESVEPLISEIFFFKREMKITSVVVFLRVF